MQTKILKPKTKAQIASAAAEGAQVLGAGGLVAFPTETVYGVAAAVESAAGLERLRDLKDRPARPFSVHVADAGQVGRYVAEVPASAARLIARGWPGAITVVLPTGGRLAEERLQRAGLHETLCYEGFIGLRCPDEPAAAALLAGVPGPVAATSANLKGRPSPLDAQAVLADLDGRIDLLIDTGPTRRGGDSTIVQFEGDGWKIVRAGACDEKTVRDLASLRLLFVCTGNTCRSPMAAGLAADLYADRGVVARSAGLAADEGAPPALNAVKAARELGADIRRHRAQIVTPELIRWADVVFCMTGHQVAEVRRLEPAARTRVRRLDADEDVPDPFGGSLDEYRHTAAALRAALDRCAREGWI